MPAVPVDQTGPAPGRAGAAHVAILMRTRDRPILLARALAGVLAQRHRDWHLLLVNDGGDATAVDRLVSRHQTGFDGRISVLHHAESVGMEAASNAALALADRTGAFDYVVVHDDDDSWHPAFLERTTAWLRAPEHAGFAAVMTRWTVVREQLDRDGVVEHAREPAPFDWPAVRFDALSGRNRFPPICLLLRRSVVAQAGPFAASMPVLGDWDFNLRVMALGDIGVLPEALAFYHQRDAGALPQYLNSADQGVAPHALEAVLYRNAQLRALVRAEPSALGVLGALGVQAEAQHERAEQQRALVLANLDRNGLWGHARHEDLQGRLVRVEQTLARMEAALSALRAAPSGWSPRRLLPAPAARLLRRLIDRMRRGSA